jgi:hypothetical protein
MVLRKSDGSTTMGNSAPVDSSRKVFSSSAAKRSVGVARIETTIAYSVLPSVASVAASTALATNAAAREVTAQAHEHERINLSSSD